MFYKLFLFENRKVSCGADKGLGNGLLLNTLLFQEECECPTDKRTRMGNDEDNTVIGMFLGFPDMYCHSILKKRQYNIMSMSPVSKVSVFQGTL